MEMAILVVLVIGACMVGAGANLVVGWRLLSNTKRFDGDSQCPQCGYEIGSGAIVRCPECGGPASAEHREQWRRADTGLVQRAHDRLTAGLMLFVIGVVLCAVVAVATELFAL